MLDDKFARREGKNDLFGGLQTNKRQGWTSDEFSAGMGGWGRHNVDKTLGFEIECESQQIISMFSQLSKRL